MQWKTATNIHAVKKQQGTFMQWKTARNIHAVENGKEHSCRESGLSSCFVFRSWEL